MHFTLKVASLHQKDMSRTRNNNDELDQQLSVCLVFFNEVLPKGEEEVLEMLVGWEEVVVKSFYTAIGKVGKQGGVESKEVKEVKEEKKAQSLLKKYGPLAVRNDNIPQEFENYSGSATFEELDYVKLCIKQKLLLIQRNKTGVLTNHLELANALTQLQPHFDSQSKLFLFLRSNFNISRR
jgi:hypothetical protein